MSVVSPVSARPTTAGDVVGTAWVLSRHLLMAQVVASALQHQGEDACAVAWDDAFGRRHEVDPERDVVVVIDDLTVPGALDDIARVVRLCGARVVVLTAHPATHVWGGLFAAGVSEVVSSTGSLPALADAVVRIAAGGTLTAEPDRQVWVALWQRSQDEERELIRRLALLSPRERTVLDLLANGVTVAGIEAELGISESTVRSQVKSLRRKLGVDSQIAAVAALRRARHRAGRPVIPGQRGSSDG